MAGRRGFGRLRKLPSGNYQAGYVGPDLATHYAETTFDAKVDAESWLSDERRIVESGSWIPPKLRQAYEEANRPPTLREYAKGWLTSRDLKPRTRELYRNLLDDKILPSLGDLELPMLTPMAVRKWHTELGPNRPTQRAHAYSLLRSILQTAVSEQIITLNPCLIRGAGQTRRKREPVPATVEQLATIASHMPERLQVAVHLAAWTALRQGELLELRRGDIDLDAGVIRVRRAVARVAGEAPIVGSTKSQAGERDVHLPPHIIPAVRDHLERFVPPAKDALLFIGRDSGEQLASSTLYRHFYPAREAAERPDLRWHDLRHTGATMAAQAGATVAELQARLGHSTVAAAMKYQHAAKSRDAEIAAALSKMAGAK